jgi:hypothetical protein
MQAVNPSFNKNTKEMDGLEASKGRILRRWVYQISAIIIMSASPRSASSSPPNQKFNSSSSNSNNSHPVIVNSPRRAQPTYHCPSLSNSKPNAALKASSRDSPPHLVRYLPLRLNPITTLPTPIPPNNHSNNAPQRRLHPAHAPAPPRPPTYSNPPPQRDRRGRLRGRHDLPAQLLGLGGRLNAGVCGAGAAVKDVYG